MVKTCFECGIEGEGWTGPVFSSAVKLKEFYKNLGISDPVIEKMQDIDSLCSKCAGNAECRHALKCFNHYKEKWTPDQYEIWAKNNTNLISIAEKELKELKKTTDNSSKLDFNQQINNETKVKAEKLAIIEGTMQNGQIDSTGKAIIHSDLSKKFEEFCAAHKGKIIDWNVSKQSSPDHWVIFIRYID